MASSSTSTSAAIVADPAPVHVCVIGNLNMDLLMRGARTLPTWGHEVDVAGQQLTTAGQAGYLALGLAAAGAQVSVLGVVGDDRWGEEIIGDLAHAGVSVDGVDIVSGARTGLTVAIVRPDGERAFVSDFGSSAAVTEATIDRLWAHGRAAQAVCLVGQFNLPALGLDAAARLFRRARDEGRTTVLDTGWDPSGWPPRTLAGVRGLLAVTDVFLPNLDEAEAISGTRDPEAAARMLQELGPTVVVVKCAEHGSVGRSGSASAAVSAPVVTVVDAVGAGDAYDAAFLRAHLAGAALGEAMRQATAAAAVYVTRERDRHPSRQQIEAASAPVAITSPTVVSTAVAQELTP
jgi:sugar/nucleoside kinase (ribokinase family)